MCLWIKRLLKIRLRIDMGALDSHHLRKRIFSLQSLLERKLLCVVMRVSWEYVWWSWRYWHTFFALYTLFLKPSEVFFDFLSQKLFLRTWLFMTLRLGLKFLRWNSIVCLKLTDWLTWKVCCAIFKVDRFADRFLRGEFQISFYFAIAIFSL